MVARYATEEELADILSICDIHSKVIQDVDEEGWLNARNSGIGGSEVGSICGVNKWSSALQVYLRKTNMYEEEHSLSAKERMHWGHMLEPVVAQEFEARFPDFFCVEPGCTLKRKDAPYLLANVDRFVLDKQTRKIIGILECKTANENLNEEWANGEVPISYMYQVQHYLYVTGLKHAWISCLVGGNKFYTYDIFFDEQLYTSVIKPALDEFWFENVLKLQEPKVQSADNGFFDTLFVADSTANEPVSLADNKFDIIGDQLSSLKAQKKQIEEEIDKLQAEIKAALQDHIIGYSPSYEYKWSPRSRTGIDSTLLRTEYPEVYDACSKVTTYRQMSIKKVVSDD